MMSNINRVVYFRTTADTSNKNESIYYSVNTISPPVECKENTTVSLRRIFYNASNKKCPVRLVCSVIKRHSVVDPGFFPDRLCGIYIIPKKTPSSSPSNNLHELVIKNPISLPCTMGTHDTIEMSLFQSTISPDSWTNNQMIFELCFSTPI